jgi:hypothetical protein
MIIMVACCPWNAPIRHGFTRSTWRLIALLVSMPTAVLVFGVIYMLGSTYLEGKPVDFWSSLEWASETLTTTGYGAYAPWKHPVMILLVILTQFVGMFFLVLVFPVYVLPYIEERFEMRLPHVLPPMAGRVLFYGYGPALDSLLEEFQRVGSAFVIFEEDMRWPAACAIAATRSCSASSTKIRGAGRRGTGAGGGDQRRRPRQRDLHSDRPRAGVRGSDLRAGRRSPCTGRRC